MSQKLDRKPQSKSPKEPVRPAPRRVVMAPTLTSFDLLGDDYRLSRNARITNYIAIGIALILILGVAAWGVLSSLDASSERSKADQAASSQIQLSRKLAGTSAAGALSEEQMNTQIAKRVAEAKAATAQEIDVVRVLSSIDTAVPAGVTVTAITFPGGVATGTPAASTSTTTGNTVTITATASSYPLVAAWMQSIRSIGSLQGADTKWSGSGNAITMSTTATLGPDVIGTRANDVAARFPSGGAQ